jgi:large subunit ribosomal protein L3
MKLILGKKIEMSQIFNKEGKIIPVTLVEAGPCFITQVKTEDKDGYSAFQIGFKKMEKKNKIKKSQIQKPFKVLKEFKKDKLEYKIGDEISISDFKEGDVVKVAGVSKGKGFQGVVKRWKFAGMCASHGVKHHQRTPGSIGWIGIGRVIKGKKMPGRMGANRVTVKNLKIVKIDKENNIIAIKGAVPGKKGTLLEIRG